MEYLFFWSHRPNPDDRIWGIGLVADNPNIENPHSWQGTNLLGFALMEVRQFLHQAIVEG
jgi:predicted NAD-dependent protein-ADP-ribosyltransferase YbiA (DUF1768 family)